MNMRKILMAAAASLLVSAGASFATTTVNIVGSYSLLYTPDSSANGVTGNGGSTGAPTLTSNTSGADGAVGTNFFNNSFSSTTSATASFNQTLTVGANATTMNLFVADPANSCGSNCSTTTNSKTGTTNTQTGTIQVTFTFTAPGGATGTMTETGQYYADYNAASSSTANKTVGGNCVGGSASQTDCIIWSSSNDPVVVSFNDGYTLTATLNNAQDWNITPTISLSVAPTPTQTNVPEPASIAILGGAILGLGLVRRRRK